MLKNCEKKSKNIRKTSNFSKKSKGNLEYVDRKKDKFKYEYTELKFNQHKENIHKFKDEFNHGVEGKKKNKFINKSNIYKENEEEHKNDVKIIINNTEYK